MSYQESTYRGDTTHTIDCTGDVVLGDRVAFERATFSGSYRSAKFAGFEKIQGTIISDSYGKDKQQHTFTIHLENNECIKIKGRNLYANGVWRARWPNEAERVAACTEKHKRGDEARAARTSRIEASFTS